MFSMMPLLLLGSLIRDDRLCISGNIIVADFRGRRIISKHLLIFSTSESCAVHAIVVDPEIVKDKENNVGEIGKIIEGAVVDHLKELTHTGNHAHCSSGEAACSPRSTNDFVFLVEDASHVYSHSENGVPKEGNPSEATLEKHIGDLHANIRVDTIIGVGLEDVSSSSRSLEHEAD